MKKTLIVYQFPLALPDVYRWAADQKVELVPQEINQPIYCVYKKEETIRLTPFGHMYQADFVPYDKLVLWGAFTAAELRQLCACAPSQ